MAKHSTPPHTLKLEAFLPYRLSVLSERVSRALAKEYSTLYALSVPEWRVIAALGQGRTLSQNEIAELTAMDKVTVSRAVKALGAKDYVVVTSDTGDKRRRQLTLTPSAQRVYTDISAKALRFEQALLSALSAAQQDALDTILKTLEQHV